MTERPDRVLGRHVAVGVAARATAVAIGAVRITLIPVRPLVTGVAGAPPLAPLRRLASDRTRTLALRGVEVEHRMVEAGLRRLDALASGLAQNERAAALVSLALAGPLTDRIAGAVVDHSLTSLETEQLISRTLERPELERLIVLALDSPATDRIVQCVLAAPGVELAITRVLESELLDAATARFLDSEEIERVIARIAEGPELRAAVAAQSAGLADMVADEIRGRSAAADETAERLARSLVPRRWRHGPPAGAAGT